MFNPPSMTPQQIADCPLFAPTVRVSCYQHSCTLYVGDEVPEGGAEAVAAAAGCPAWSFGTPPENFADCPVPAEIERLRAESAAPVEVLPAPLPPIVSGSPVLPTAATAGAGDEPAGP